MRVLTASFAQGKRNTTLGLSRSLVPTLNAWRLWRIRPLLKQELSRGLSNTTCSALAAAVSLSVRIWANGHTPPVKFWGKKKKKTGSVLHWYEEHMLEIINNLDTLVKHKVCADLCYTSRHEMPKSTRAQSQTERSQRVSTGMFAVTKTWLHHHANLCGQFNLIWSRSCSIYSLKPYRNTCSPITDLRQTSRHNWKLMSNLLQAGLCPFGNLRFRRKIEQHDRYPC